MRSSPVCWTAALFVACVEHAEPAEGDPDASSITDAGPSDDGGPGDPHPSTVVAELRSCPNAVAVDVAFVYLGGQGGPILRVPKSGGTAEVASTEGAADLAADGDAAYVANGRSVSRIADDAFTPEVFIEEAATQIAVRQGVIYWTTDAPCNFTCERPLPILSTASAGGGGTTHLASGSSRSSFLDLAIGDSMAFLTGWLGSEAARVYRVPLLGGEPVVCSDDVAYGPVAAGPDDAFMAAWIQQTMSEIVRIPADGSPPSTFGTVAADLWDIGIAADASGAYWLATAEAGTLATRDLAGGDVRTLAADLRWPQGIALDDQFVYIVECATARWVGGIATGWLRRIAK